VPLVPFDVPACVRPVPGNICFTIYKQGSYAHMGFICRNVSMSILSRLYSFYSLHHTHAQQKTTVTGPHSTNCGAAKCVYNAFRCGAAGTQLFKNADLVYGAERSSSFTGLLGRMTMYKNYWLPLKGRLYAALRIRKQLIARPGQRVGIDSFGAQYNIDRGNQTLVLTCR